MIAKTFRMRGRKHRLLSTSVLLMVSVLLLPLGGCQGGAHGVEAYQADSRWGCRVVAGTIECPGGRRR